MSNYGSDVISEVPHSETYLNDMENQSVHAMQDFEQSPVVDFTDNEIHSDSNIIPYSQYLQETQLTIVQDTTLQAQQDSMILSVIEQMSEQMINHVSLVNASLKKLKFHLTQFDSVVKKRTTPDAHTEGECGFEHTKAIFNNEIIPFLKSLKDIFNVFDKDLLNEIMEVQIVFNQMDVDVQQSSVDKQCLEIAKKELLLENDRLLQQIMSQDVILTIMNSMSLNGESVNIERKRNESCDKCFNLDVELLKSQNAHNDLLKRKEIVDIAAQISSANIIVLEGFMLDLRSFCSLGIVEQAKAKQPLDNALDFACKHAQRIQELLVESSTTSYANTPVLSPIGLKCSASNCGSKPTGNTKNDRISQTPSRNIKNKVEAQSRKKSMFDGVHDMCLLDFVENAKIVESKNANHSEPNHTWGSNATDIPSSSSLVMTGCPDCSLLRFENDHIARIMGYGDYQLGNVTISRVYYVEGLGHNLFSVGQFCDADLEVSFWKNTCFIRNLEGVDLLSGSRDRNLYIISLDDMLKTSSICLLSKASKTKSWLWHRRLSHINFGTLNKLAKDGLARGIPRLKFQKDHLCSALALGKSKKSSHQPKAEDTNQEKLYLLHMDLCGPMHVASINGKSYIIVIVDDYSRFTW
ncbi:retrovirus-related pol polyprotein from transposon TNT 1-94, partial [Tanacetum coccineum]